MNKYLVTLHNGTQTTVKAKNDNEVLTELFWAYCIQMNEVQGFEIIESDNV